MERRKRRTWFVMRVAVCTTVTGLGNHPISDQCIDVLGKVAVMEKPWPDWVEVMRVPNAVIDSIGPGRYAFTERYEDEAFVAYRVTIRPTVSGYVIRDSLVRQCGEGKRRSHISLGGGPAPITPESAQSAPAHPG